MGGGGCDEREASPWGEEDALREGVEIHNFLVPKAFLHEKGQLTGVRFEKVRAEYDAQGRRNLVPTGEAPVDMPCDEVLVAIGQDNAFGWIERDLGLAFDSHGMPQLNAKTLQSTLPRVFFGGDSALGPKNIITAVAQGHDAAISIDRFCNGEPLMPRPDPRVTMTSQKMGIHEWSYHNQVSEDARKIVPSAAVELALKDIKLELELGYELKSALKEAERCLNCDMQTVFTESACIECDSCVDICPTECITFTANGEEPDLRSRLKAPAPLEDQDLYVSDTLKTGRVMVKDENVCLHCGMCAERCPTGAWDMQKFLLDWPQAQAQVKEVET